MRHSIRFALAALVVLCSTNLVHAIPQLINYQGVLTDGGGTPITVATSVEFRIWDMGAGGTELWMEATSVTPDANGQFRVLLGSVNAIPDSAFDGDAFLGITVAADPEMTPRSQLVSVGYSYRTGTVDGATGGNITSKVSIGAGHTNTGNGAFVAGGSNSVLSEFAVVGGGELNTAAGSTSIVAGGFRNGAMAADATVGGGFADTASGYRATVAGGDQNHASGDQSAIGGGVGNRAAGEVAAIGGGSANQAAGYSATVAGGINNWAIASWATVAGGNTNIAADTGGTISGGHNNKIDASCLYGTIAGGEDNTVSEIGGAHSTVGGGSTNTVRGIGSTVAGGMFNDAGLDGDSGAVISGGYFNLNNHKFGSIGGGALNGTTGDYATIAGGRSNRAGTFAFAAGRRANADHAGSFVWGDSFDGDVASSAADEFTVRASGGVRFFSNTALTTGITLAAGGGAWASISDRNAKQNIRPVDGAEMLDKISQLDISRWNYESQDASIEHIGPMAQDFYRLFRVGDNDKTITTIDPDGIALAAIKELCARNALLEERVEQLTRTVERLSAEQ